MLEVMPIDHIYKSALSGTLWRGLSHPTLCSELLPVCCFPMWSAHGCTLQFAEWYMLKVLLGNRT